MHLYYNAKQYPEYSFTIWVSTKHPVNIYECASSWVGAT